MNAPVSIQNISSLVPNSLKDSPALIESVFPAQKVSFEAQLERTAVQSQTLTGLGSYWKGRKPLILVRAIVLGCLLPKSSDPEIDLEMYEALLGFDLEGLARRAVDAGTVKPKDILAAVTINDPGIYFTIQEKWRRDISINDKVALVRSFLATLQTYEERVIYCKRSEEVDQEFLLAPVWQRINEHYSHLGINASTLPELIEQLGLLRYGHKPKVGDVFAGGGSIPFEAARLGCDAFASDLNPVACMLNWGGINIVGVSPEQRQKIIAAQQTVVDLVENNLARLGIEHDSRGNRAKAYLYCIEARCPETGWLVPLIPSLVISKSRNVRAILIPDPAKKRFKIELQTGVGAQEMKDAEKGTVRDGCMVYCLDGKTYTTSIKTLRGDYRLPSGENGNRLRSWELNDVTPRTDDVFQERLYAIQWITKETLNKARQETFFAAVTAEDIEREDVVEALVSSNLAVWQASGLVPDMAIEPGYNTTQPMRERGWSYWHHLFCARQILVGKLVKEALQTLPADMQCVLSLSLAKMMDWSSKLCRYGTGAARESIAQTFYNQAFNTNFSYGVRSFVTGKNYLFLTDSISEVHGRVQIENIPASQIDVVCDIWVTDPPYADAVNYHEIAEFFIAWLRKNPPAPFDQWKWDSRRALAITGDGDDFRRGMIEAYAAMAKKMPDNGMQCVLFTHQDTGVWADMVGIFWAAGLQVVAAWYLATEISTELKKGGYVQGTVTLMLKKRPAGDNPGFKQRILPAVRVEVKTQIEQMMHLNEEARNPHAHIMLTLRELSADGQGFGAKRRDWNSPALLENWRGLWSEHSNKMLAEQGHDVRIDHRSLAEQGIAGPATVHVGRDTGINSDAVQERRDFNALVLTNRELARIKDEERSIHEQLTRITSEIIDLETTLAEALVERDSRASGTDSTQSNEMPSGIVLPGDADFSITTATPRRRPLRSRTTTTTQTIITTEVTPCSTF